MTAIEQIGQLWDRAVGGNTGPLFQSICELSESAVDIVDRIIEAGWNDDTLIPPDDTLDEMRDIAIAADEASPTQGDFAAAVQTVYHGA